jgi:hypothetical protein
MNFLHSWRIRPMRAVQKIHGKLHKQTSTIRAGLVMVPAQHPR